MPRTSAMLSAIAMIDARYLVNVGSTWLRLMAARTSAATRLISQRPMNQNASAARTLSARSMAVVLRNCLVASMSTAAPLGSDGLKEKTPARSLQRGFGFRSLAVTYSCMAKDHTTIGAERFHFRVRKGIGW